MQLPKLGQLSPFAVVSYTESVLCGQTASLLTGLCSLEVIFLVLMSIQAEAGEVRRMLEEASAQIAQQAQALGNMGDDVEQKAAELAVTQAQLKSALTSLDNANASIAESQEIISSLKLEGSGGCGVLWLPQRTAHQHQDCFSNKHCACKQVADADFRALASNHLCLPSFVCVLQA